MKINYKYALKKITCFSLDTTSLDTFCREAENLLEDYALELKAETKERRKNSRFWEIVDYFEINSVEQSPIQSMNLDKEIFYKDILLDCEYPSDWEAKVKKQLDDKLKLLKENYKDTLDYIIEHFSVSKE